MSDETDETVTEPEKEKDNIKPIWTRLEKTLEKLEKSPNQSHSKQSLDLMGFMNFRLSIEKISLELSISTITSNDKTFHTPPNLKLAAEISDYINLRLFSQKV